MAKNCALRVSISMAWWVKPAIYLGSIICAFGIGSADVLGAWIGRNGFKVTTDVAPLG